MNPAPSQEQRFGKFMLLGRLSGGGIAASWIAYDLEAAKVVVLKRLTRERAESISADRFRDEIRISFELSHRNLVRPRETGVIENEVYLVLEWIQGQNLIQLEEQSRKYDPITLPIAATIVLSICEALEYATKKIKGFVHRDISPGNIIVGYDGVTHLVDYGFAVSPLKVAKTNVGDVPGTPGFVAPERRFGRADVRSDLYALASVALFLMTGGRRMEPIEKTANSDELAQHPFLASAAELIPFLTRALAREPEDRYQCIADFSAALRNATGQPLASEAEVGEFVSALFANQKANTAEDFQNWHRRFGQRSASSPPLTQQTLETTIAPEIEAEETPMLVLEKTPDTESAQTTRSVAAAPRRQRHLQSICRSIGALLLLVLGAVFTASKLRKLASSTAAAPTSRRPEPWARIEPVTPPAAPTVSPAGREPPNASLPEARGIRAAPSQEKEPSRQRAFSKVCAGLTRAIEAYLAGEYEGATRLARACLKVDPGNGKARKLIERVTQLRSQPE